MEAKKAFISTRTIARCHHPPLLLSLFITLGGENPWPAIMDGSLHLRLDGHHIDPLLITIMGEQSLYPLALYQIKPVAGSLDILLHESEHPDLHRTWKPAIPTTAVDRVKPGPPPKREPPRLLLAPPPGDGHRGATTPHYGKLRLGIGEVSSYCPPIEKIEYAATHS
jgi:hypothetical protein